jgi:hypothetical protein
MDILAFIQRRIGCSVFDRYNRFFGLRHYQNEKIATRRNI